MAVYYGDMERQKGKREQSEVNDDLAVSGFYVESYEQQKVQIEADLQTLRNHYRQLSDILARILDDPERSDSDKQKDIEAGAKDLKEIQSHIDAVNAEVSEVRTKLESEITSRKVLLAEHMSLKEDKS